MDIRLSFCFVVTKLKIESGFFIIYFWLLVLIKTNKEKVKKRK